MEVQKRGKFIVIEGSDGTGKETQSNLLLERINSSGVLELSSAHLLSFPDYDSPAGKKIRAYLNGEMGDVEDVSPQDAAMLYAEDRRAKKEEMENILNRGDWIIADRYIQSNMAYQGAKIRNRQEREIFYRWLSGVEYNDFKIPKPDLVVMLNLDLEVAAKHLAKRDQFDIHEKNAPYLERVRVEYERFSSGYYNIFFENWCTVSCSHNGEQLSREDIAQSIWNTIHRKIKI